VDSLSFTVHVVMERESGEEGGVTTTGGSCCRHIERRVRLVAAPSSPVPVVNPAGVRMVVLYFSWKCLIAFTVATPYLVVSFPFDPAPSTAT
jgi:hypothetical protein